MVLEFNTNQVMEVEIYLVGIKYGFEILIKHLRLQFGHAICCRINFLSNVLKLSKCWC